MDAKEFRSPDGRRTAPSAKWIIAIILATVCVGLMAELVNEQVYPLPQGRAQAQPSEPLVRGNILLASGQVASDTYAIFLVDMANGSLGVYQWVPSNRKLRLMAVRNYIFDLQLDEYNTEPLPREIRDLVRQHRRLDETTPPGESRE